ncbi:5-hydroxytryptamine receptor 3A [Pelobates cultripes]|uniref:5-hydroxytryptamine receptor 3A n=1 Tax=Pelobates cultripes TaxID=61616 RepID=A0AAD1WRK1_PELCU|nr:5-hydroxytryptamine receptor 3A [Pelobates cultripes]
MNIRVQSESNYQIQGLSKKTCFSHIEPNLKAQNEDEKNQMLTTYIWYNQSWVDEFLTWDPNDYENVTQMTFPTNSVWIPDIFILEFVDIEKSPDVPFVSINNEGRIHNNKPIQIVTSCNLNIYYFPFDLQNCTLTFTSWIHPIEDINISVWKTLDEIKEDKNLFKNEGEWELLNLVPRYNMFNDEGEVFGEAKFDVDEIIFKRRSVFYVVNLILPSTFLMVMDIVGYYLPPECGERISFKITLLLGYSVFLIIVSDTLPPTSIGTPLIEGWGALYFIICMVLLVISLSESIFVVRIVQKKNFKTPVPNWMKKLVLEKITFLLCTKDLNKLNESRTLSSEVSWQNENSYTEELSKYNHVKIEDDKGSDEDILAIGGKHTIMAQILKEIASIRSYLEMSDDNDITRQWLQIVYVLDRLLFRLYLLLVLTYIVTLSVLWSNCDEPSNLLGSPD